MKHKILSKRISKVLLGTLITGVIVSASYITPKAMSLFYASSGRRNINVYVEARFTPNTKTTNTNYGLVKGKYVKKVTIRLRQGDYDQKKSTTTSKLISIEKFNNPFATAYGNWSWTYK